MGGTPDRQDYMMKTAIVDYGAGNLASVERAVAHLGFKSEVTQDADRVSQADRVIFPGVGAAGAAMNAIRKHGLDDALLGQVAQGTPVLGICIGIQILFERSQEDGTTCLGVLEGEVRRFQDDPDLKVPQIGWNQVRQAQPHPLWEGVPDGAECYFVNSYYPVPTEPHFVIGRTAYGVEFASAVARGNLVATQFHLEKSGPVGLTMLENFMNWRP